MSTNATVSKECPSGFSYLVPGRLAMNNEHNVSFSSEDEIVVDAMLADGVGTATYTNLVIVLTLPEPAGCEFLLPVLPADHDLLKNDIVLDFPNPDDHSVCRASVTPDMPQTLNRGNSKSFRFAITGRAGREIKLQISITAQPLSVEVDSCLWTVGGFDLDTVNLGMPLDALP